MPRPRPRHLVKQVSRHGKIVWYFRRGKGPRIRIKGEYGSDEFMAAYEEALSGNARKRRPERAGTLGALIESYRRDAADWRRLSKETQAKRDPIFDEIVDGAGDNPFSKVSRATIQASIDKRKPHAAVAFLKAVRGLFQWAMKLDLVSTDPTAGIKVDVPRSDGHHTWTDDEVARFEERWPIGTRERVAFDVLLYTGFRRGDAARFGPEHVSDGMISIVTEKTDTPVSIPMLDCLRTTLDAGPTGATTFICAVNGAPLTKESFGNWFAEACKAAGVPGRAHGLRKAGATRAAENGATESQLNAIFGWAEGSKQSATYIRKANRKRMARDAMKKLERGNERAG